MMTVATDPYSPAVTNHEHIELSTDYRLTTRVVRSRWDARSMSVLARTRRNPHAAR